MKHVFLAAALLAAVSASAQSADPSDVLPGAMGDALEAARAAGAKMAPAPVDPKPVAELFERLAKDGEQIQTEDGTEDAYQRFAIPDKSGSRLNLRVGVVETGAPAAESEDGTGDSMYRDLVMRRYFTSLEAQSEEWSVGKDGSGKIDLWHFSVSLDGRLISVEHDVVPLALGPDGKSAPDSAHTQVTRVSPSDKAVQKRWKALTKKLLLLGRTSQA